MPTQRSLGTLSQFLSQEHEEYVSTKALASKKAEELTQGKGSTNRTEQLAERFLIPDKEQAKLTDYNLVIEKHNQGLEPADVDYEWNGFPIPVYKPYV